MTRPATFLVAAICFACGVCSSRAADTPAVVPNPTRNASSIHNVYSNPACGLQFSYPQDWETETDFPSGQLGECTVLLSPAASRMIRALSKVILPEVPISVTASNSPFVETLKTHGWQQSPNGWVPYPDSVYTTAPQTPKHLGKLLMLSAGRYSNSSYKNGGNAGAVEDRTVILGNESRSVIIEVTTNDDAVVWDLVWKTIVLSGVKDDADGT